MNNTVNSHPWSTDALFVKAQLYMEQMESTTSDKWQFGLWSALCLEMLSRAALAHISPVLLVADSRNWRNIMYALGNVPTAKKFSPASISIKEVFTRLAELLPEFGDETGFCIKHMERRNAELHSGEIAFSTLTSTSRWLPQFYIACKILLESIGKTLSDLVSDPVKVCAMIASRKDAVAKATRQDINKYNKLWSDKTKEEQETALLQATAWATRYNGHRVECLSCGSPALLHGTPSGPVSTDTGDDGVIERQTMIPTLFECVACGLKMSGYSNLFQCGLGDTFSQTTTHTAKEYFGLYTESDIEEARNQIPDDFDYDGYYAPDDFNKY